MKIIIAGGGTGGHIYPALSIARKFREKNHSVIMVGRKDSLEEKIYKENGFTVRTIHSAVLEFTSKEIFIFVKNGIIGMFNALSIIQKEVPDAVIGVGGYVSAPMLLASCIRGKKRFIYEQNIIPGRTNRIFGKVATAVFLGFPDIYHFFSGRNVVFTGNPVRKEILSADKEKSLSYFNFSPNVPTLLVFGGSGGARKINFTFAHIAKKLMSKINLQIIFITGKRDFDEISNILKIVPNNLVVLPYLDNMEYAFKVSDFAITRGGAMTITEIVHSKLPALIIPFPFARDNHQLKNALLLKERGCVDVALECDLSEDFLIEKLFYYFSHIDIMKKKMENCANFFPEDSAGIIYEKVMEKING